MRKSRPEIVLDILEVTSKPMNLTDIMHQTDFYPTAGGPLLKKLVKLGFLKTSLVERKLGGKGRGALSERPRLLMPRYRYERTERGSRLLKLGREFFALLQDEQEKKIQKQAKKN